MSLSKEQVEKVADLARLGLSTAEIEKFAGQLSGILQYVELLNEVDTEGVEPTYQSTGMTNQMQVDEVQTEGQATANDLLECTQLPVQARQIVVKNVF